MNEAAVYSSYRATLRKARRVSQSRDSRAARRKQEARKETADKFGVPIREVKDIVRRHDALNGITHEHPKPYLNQLAVKAARERMAGDLTDTSSCWSCRYTLPAVKDALVRFKPEIDLSQITVFRGVLEDEADWDPESDDPYVADPYYSMVWECIFCNHGIDIETGASTRGY